MIKRFLFWTLCCGALGCATVASTPPRSGGASPSAGTLLIHVYGDLRDIVLIDPLGRVDQDADTVTSDIPECARWPDGMRELALDEDVPDSLQVAMTSFELGFVQHGAYQLQAQADRKTDVRVECSFRPEPDSLKVGGARSTRRDLLSPGHYSWTIDLRPLPPNTKQTVTIAGPTKHKDSKKQQ